MCVSLHSSLFDSILKDGKNELSLELGIVSKVDGEDYELIAIDDVTNDYKPGEVLELSNTFCREVVVSRKTIALTEYEKVQGLSRHPLYSVNALEAYIGAPIFLDGNIWGTVNFSSMMPRNSRFSESEIKLVNSFADSIAESLIFSAR